MNLVVDFMDFSLYNKKATGYATPELRKNLHFLDLEKNNIFKSLLKGGFNN